MEPLLIMVLVLVEVALWQWRVAITVRGSLLGGAVLGLVGAVVQITVIARVVQSIGDVVEIAGYAFGVAAGVLLGCLIDRRLASREVCVRVVTPADPTLVPSLRAGGWPLTATRGEGHHGPVEVVLVAIDQRRLATLEAELRTLAPRACWTVEKLSGSYGLVPAVS